MKINTYQFTESSFLSIDKDMATIVNKMFENNNLKKLLHYTTKDCLKQPKLSEKETYGLFGKEIKIVPKLSIDGNVLNYIIIDFDNFTPNATNPEFRDNIISFDIICHFDQWHLEDFQLRPYRIAAELDSMFNEQRFSGIGKLQFLSGNKIVINEEYAGFTLMYAAIHGDEDKRNPLTPISYDEEYEDGLEGGSDNWD